MSPDPLTEQLQQLSLQPPAIDRDRLLFEAGRRSVQPSKVWPVVTTMSLALAMTMGALYLQQLQPTIPTQMAQATLPVPTIPETVQAPVKQAEPFDPNLPYAFLASRDLNPLNKPLPYRTSNIKPLPLLTAGSYAQPNWQQ